MYYYRINFLGGDGTPTNQTKPFTYSKDVQDLYLLQAVEFKSTNIQLLTLVENYYLLTSTYSSKQQVHFSNSVYVLWHTSQ